jgi:hypothetical protein
MKRADIEQLIQTMRENAKDNEWAHGLEDSIREQALGAIASGEVTGDEARDLARLALSTSAIKFDRWYA